MSKNIQRIFQDHNEFMKSKFPSYDVFEEWFLEISYDKFNMVKYVLSKINNKLEMDKSKDDTHDYSLFSIEHILPKDPSKWWLTVEEIKGYVNKLWNLTLLWSKTNWFVGNDKLYDKIEKEKWIKASKIAITQLLVEDIINNNYIWTKESIEKRHKDLCEKMYHKVCSF